MLPFPNYENILNEFGKNSVNPDRYVNAKKDYERKLQTEAALLAQFRGREGLTEEEAVTVFCEFLIREAVYIAQHDSN